jgi:hypothetical protein
MSAPRLIKPLLRVGIGGIVLENDGMRQSLAPTCAVSIAGIITGFVLSFKQMISMRLIGLGYQ